MLILLECFCCKKEFEEKDITVIDGRNVCKNCNHLKDK